MLRFALLLVAMIAATVLSASADDRAPDVDTSRTGAAAQGTPFVVAAFQKDARSPAPSTGRSRRDRDRLSRNFFLIGCGLLLPWYIWAWKRVGEAPKSGPIIPQFAPPGGFSPVSCRFIDHNYYDANGLGVALVSAAIKGQIKINKIKRFFTTDYEIIRTPNQDTHLSSDEAAALDAVFADDDIVAIRPDERAPLVMARGVLGAKLDEIFQDSHRRSNLIYCTPGLLVTPIVLGAICGLSADPLSAIGSTAVLTLMLISVSTGFALLVPRWRLAWWQGRASVLWAVFWTGLLGLLIFATQRHLTNMIETIGLTSTVESSLFILLNALFIYLLNIPTVLGQRMKEKVRGFRMFLGSPTVPWSGVHGAPDLTPELFKRFLAYAVALGVEAAWVARFKATLPDGQPYRPTWFVDSPDLRPNDLTNFAAKVTMVLRMDSLYSRFSDALIHLIFARPKRSRKPAEQAPEDGTRGQ